MQSSDSAAKRPNTENRETPNEPATPAGDTFETFLAEGMARRAQADAERAQAARDGVERPQDWADPDPAACQSSPRHPIDRALARSKPGRTRQNFASNLRITTQILAGGEDCAMTMDDVRGFAWHQVSVEDASDFREAVYRRYRSQASRNEKVCALRRVVSECYRARLVSALRRDLLMEELYTITPGESVRRRRLAATEIADLMVACEQTGSPRTAARNTAIVALFRTTGMRISELVGIDLADWDQTDRSIVLPQTKNGQAHCVLLAPVTESFLRRWLAHRGTAPGALFTALNRGDTRPVHPVSVRYMLQTRARVAGVAPFGPHDFRRTFATDLLERFDAALVSKLLNHRKIDSTLAYDLRGDAEKREAVSTLDLTAPEDEPGEDADGAEEVAA